MPIGDLTAGRTTLEINDLKFEFVIYWIFMNAFDCIDVATSYMHWGK